MSVGKRNPKALLVQFVELGDLINARGLGSFSTPPGQEFTHCVPVGRNAHVVRYRMVPERNITVAKRVRRSSPLIAKLYVAHQVGRDRLDAVIIVHVLQRSAR